MLVPLHEYRAMLSPAALTSVPTKDLPDDIRDRLAAGQESPVRVLRKYRGMTQATLALAAGLSRPYLTEIERGAKDGSLAAIKALAQALDVPPGWLI